MPAEEATNLEHAARELLEEDLHASVVLTRLVENDRLHYLLVEHVDQAELLVGAVRRRFDLDGA